MSNTIPEQNTLLDGRFRLNRILGSGAMGTTWLALDEESGAEVAVKVLRLQDAGDWKVVELFERELISLKSLTHPGIPSFIGGRIDVDDQQFFIVQEYAGTTNLAGVLETRGRLPEVEVRAIAEQVLETLTYLQTRQPPLIHRDIKPTNLVRGSDGTIRLVDFGALATLINNTRVGSSTVIGTFGYMPPEQFRGVALLQSDLYGLGATLIHLITGESPETFRHGGIAFELDGVEGVSSQFRLWLELMTMPNARDRFEEAAEALAALRHLDQLEGVEGDPVARLLADPGAEQWFSQKEDNSVEIEAPRVVPSTVKRGLIALQCAALCLSAAATYVVVDEMGGNAPPSELAFYGAFAAFGLVLFAVLFAIFVIVNGNRNFLNMDSSRWTVTTQKFVGSSVESGAWSELRNIVAFRAGEVALAQGLPVPVYSIRFHTDTGVYTFGDRMEQDDASALVRLLRFAAFGEDAPSGDTFVDVTEPVIEMSGFSEIERKPPPLESYAEKLRAELKRVGPERRTNSVRSEDPVTQRALQRLHERATERSKGQRTTSPRRKDLQTRHESVVARSDAES